MTRRDVLGLTAGALAGSAVAQTATAKLTEFQLACMTLPYGAFSFHRALEGIAGAGFRYAAWGTRYTNSNGDRVPVLDIDASEADARRLAASTRADGLEPVMMFSTVHLEAAEAARLHERRITHAAAA
ncbi:MAG: hypothetical protein GY953_41080, partial [bacterium]|nr:hypothetical protein [bacterium]